MEQWNSGDRAATSVVAGTLSQVDCTSDTVKPLGVRRCSWFPRL